MAYPKTLPEDRLSQAPQPSPKPATKAARASMALNSAQRNTVRIALATGATVAALIGAQTLALANRAVGQVETVQSSSVQSVGALVTAAPVTDTTNNVVQLPTTSYSTPIPTSVSAAPIYSAVVQPRPVSRASR